MRCKYAQCGEPIYTATKSMVHSTDFWKAGVIILTWRICRTVGIAPDIGRFMSNLLSPVIEHCTFAKLIYLTLLLGHFEGISNIRSFAIKHPTLIV